MVVQITNDDLSVNYHLNLKRSLAMENYKDEVHMEPAKMMVIDLKDILFRAC